MSPAYNEQRNLFSTAFDNLGVASIATGGFAAGVAYVIGTISLAGPFRLLACALLCIGLGVLLVRAEDRVLEFLRP